MKKSTKKLFLLSSLTVAGLAVTATAVSCTFERENNPILRRELVAANNPVYNDIMWTIFQKSASTQDGYAKIKLSLNELRAILIPATTDIEKNERYQAVNKLIRIFQENTFENQKGSLALSQEIVNALEFSHVTFLDSSNNNRKNHLLAVKKLVGEPYSSYNFNSQMLAFDLVDEDKTITYRPTVDLPKEETFYNFRQSNYKIYFGVDISKSAFDNLISSDQSEDEVNKRLETFNSIFEGQYLYEENASINVLANESSSGQATPFKKEDLSKYTFKVSLAEKGYRIFAGLTDTYYYLTLHLKEGETGVANSLRNFKIRVVY
ncbi:hypothetical protein [Mycoplasmopsis agassizii]|uniref:Lipoprotein n=1 Tax=Mycoplasmopsis agassizii TaxID=33922 RepID=A0ABX4H606_9BACT|nr:hypothetical protein [Mycoplasmopsis agassizii]PAF55213.1 hypothetical protein CJF60_00810 [Mycoplasmopsis agassizii]SMC18794.1 hypothetical protein SAMN02745179_00770 [Mycoplasmopsis agassizii]